MNKEELKQLLKDNLKVKFYTVGNRIKFYLYFDDEEILYSECGM